MKAEFVEQAQRLRRSKNSVFPVDLSIVERILRNELEEILAPRKTFLCIEPAYCVVDGFKHDCRCHYNQIILYLSHPTLQCKYGQSVHVVDSCFCDVLFIAGQREHVGQRYLSINDCDAVDRF